MSNAQESVIHLETPALQRALADTAEPLVIVSTGDGWGALSGPLHSLPEGVTPVAVSPKILPEQLGDRDFRTAYASRYAYMSGAMANGIASAELVVAMGQAGLLASYGAGGVIPEQLERDVQRIQHQLGEQPFAVNLIHSPHEPLMEARCVDILLRHGVRVIEASAFMELTEPLIRFRLAGVYRDDRGRVASRNKVIGKISRPEVAERFMSPAPEALVQRLVNAGHLTPEQATLGKQLPVADDVTVEADSGGHTDNRPMGVLLPLIIALRDRLQRQLQYSVKVRVGAAGGIGAPDAVLAAFAMEAAYVVTGTVNQGCVESGSSDLVRRALAQASFSDVGMAPAADMFEMGVELQVLKRGTLFPMRARRLYELYKTYASLEAIPAGERRELEEKVFKRSLEQVWEETCDFFARRDPGQIERADQDPKRKMALVFRSYLGQSSGWANAGVAERAMDFQIWAGPAIGAFNEWVAGSYLAEPGNRRVVDIAEHLMRGAAFKQRLQLLRLQGLELPAEFCQYPLAAIAQGTRRHAA